MPSTTARPAYEDLGEFVRYLGNISLKRIRMTPPPGTATEADLLAALEAPRKRLCELVDGILVDKAVGYEESIIALALASRIREFVRTHRLGWVNGADGPFRLWHGRVRTPDVAFISRKKVADGRRSTDPISSAVPDLAVEILSKSNTKKEMKRKREDYFSAGVELVWEVDAKKRSVEVFTAADQPPTVLTERDTLTGGTVLPGFKLSLAEFFGELDDDA